MKILLIEDEPVPSKLLAEFLSGKGHEVRTAPSAGEAVELTLDFTPDVLVADWRLETPATGLRAAETIKARWPHIPVIFVTGLPLEDLVPQARHLSRCSFMPKPCDLHQLLEHLERLAPSD